MLRPLVALVSLLVSAASGATVDPALFQDLHWRPIGPFRAGRVLTVSGVAGEPEHFYFGSVNGGVWETSDAGRTWNPIFDSQPIGSIGAIAVASSNPKILYVGTGEADMRSDIAQGDGMYKSVDGGKSWTKIGLADSQQIARVIVHPSDPNLVYVAALGHPYGPNAERGVFRSVDGGASWKKILGPDENTGAVDITLEPGNPNVVYAALWQTRRPPWSVYPPSNGPGSGLFKSTDAGDTWKKIDNGLPPHPGRIGLAVAPSMPNRVYAVVDAEEGGMYRSDDGGATWTRTSSDTRIWGRGWYFGGVTVEPRDPDVVYSCNVNLYRSTDGGETFQPVKGAPGGDDYHQLWIDPEHPERRILGVDQGTVISLNGGKTWSSWYNQPTGQFYHVITDNSFPYRVYGAQQDSGAAGVPSRTNTWDGINISEFREVTAGGEADNIAPDPEDPEIIYGGRVERLDMRTQQTKLIDPTIAYPGHDRRTWTLPLIFSRRDPKVLYFANQRLYRTEDGGEHWTIISPDLTRENPPAPSNLDPVTAALKPKAGGRHGVIYTIAPSRVADRDLWVGTDDGQIWRTTDEGQHWKNVTPPSITPWSKVGIVETSHFDAGTAYAAIDRHRLDDFRPYIFRTHDGGATWRSIASGIPPGSFVNVVREDGVKRGLLYAGTEKGVYVSFDDGESWQPLQMNLPVTSVRDIDVHGNDLVIATHGRAFWIMDDVSALRQIDATTSVSGVMLYRPADAIRYRPAGFTGTPWPKDEPMAPNPPSGAYIDYVLGPSVRGPVTVEILDGEGDLVRRYSSADQTPVPDLAKLKTAPEWFATPSILKTTAGMHRFIWPLRYRAPEPLAGTRGVFADGIWARPGNYSVVLTAGEERVTQPLTIVPDPRVRATSGDYDAQFHLARQVNEARAEIAKALDEATNLLDNIRKRRAELTRDVGGLLDPVEARALALSDVIPSSNPGNFWWIAPKSETSLKFLSSELEKLETAVDGTDAAPSIDARQGWEKLRGPADAAVKAWNAFKSSQLNPLNERLRSLGKDSLPLE